MLLKFISIYGKILLLAALKIMIDYNVFENLCIFYYSMQYSSNLCKIVSLCLMPSNIYIDISFKMNFQHFMNSVYRGSLGKSKIIQNMLFFLHAWLMKHTWYRSG